MLKPYNDYKNIKCDWMDTIPVHWDAQKIRELFTERKKKVSDKDYAPLSVSRGGIVPQISTVAKSNDGDNRKLVRNGDFAINSRSDRRGSSGLSVYDGSVSLINIVLCPRSSLNGRYTHYLLKSHSFIEEYYRNGRGIVADLWTTRYAEMKSIVLPLPPLSEQDQIVRYLDWQVSKTNKLISALKKQIALLKEQKRVVVNDAVSKSGEGWQQTRIINLVQNVKAGAWGEEAGGSGVDFDCVRVADFDFERLRVKNTTYTVRNYQQKVIDNLSLQKGDILIEKSGGGDKQTVGRAVMYTGEALVLYANFIEAIRTGTNVDSAYLTYLLASQYYLERNRFHFNQTTGIQNLNVKGYLRECVLIPPLKEQESLVTQLDAKCASINKLIDKIIAEISLLMEYRTRLISDVVTGQIDVHDIEVPEFECVADEANDVPDEESIDTEEMVDEEA